MTYLKKFDDFFKVKDFLSLLREKELNMSINKIDSRGNIKMSELVSQPTSVQSAYTLYREDKLFVNRRYQRKLVWTLEEKQKLIESILKKSILFPQF